MSWEAEIKTLLMAVTPLTTLLTGGIYTAEAIGRDGINRDKTATSGAFDAAPARKLRPCCFIVEFEAVDDGLIQDQILKVRSYTQRVRLHFYDFENYTTIDSAASIAENTLYGHQFTTGGALPLIIIGHNPRLREPGALKGAAMHTLDVQVRATKGS